MQKMAPQTTSGTRLDWFNQAKFGLFIHWGAYTVAGVEASWPIMAPQLSEAMFGTSSRINEQEYQALPARFNPVRFNAAEWVRCAKDAGMQYIVFTSKHHDGFCMFDAPGTDYKITNTPFKRDVCKELADACAAAGMPLGFYYSPPDMHHPGYRNTHKPALKNWLGEPNHRKAWAEYLDYMESHIRKLLTDYGKVSILWFDGLVNHAKYEPERFHHLIHTLSPDTLINDRLGDDYDYITPEQFIPKNGVPVKTHKPPSSNAADSEMFFKAVGAMFKIPGLRGWVRRQMEKYREGKLELTPVVQEPYPSPNDFQPWETCMTMGTSWGYNPDEKNWKAPGSLVRNLVEVVSRGGNYLLNVGPTYKGEFPPEARERLAYVGKWMKKNSAGIYGSTYTPLQGQKWGSTTRKGDSIFLHVTDYPADGKLSASGFPASARSVQMMDGTSLPFTQTNDQLEITLPTKAPDPDVNVIRVETAEPSHTFTSYSPAKERRLTAGKYIFRNAWINFVANCIINGLIALGTYAKHAPVSYGEAAVDVLITVFIIGFLIAWLNIGGARNDVNKGNVILPAKKCFGIPLPRGTGWGGLIIAFLMTAVFGALVIDGLLLLFAPGGFGNWAYFIFKTLYTGVTAALTSAFSILCVLREAQRKKA